eukprot:scaffold23477_cov56-Isochrysis_galbana.AAC.1
MSMGSLSEGCWSEGTVPDPFVAICGVALESSCVQCPVSSVQPAYKKILNRKKSLEESATH